VKAALHVYLGVGPGVDAVDGALLQVLLRRRPFVALRAVALGSQVLDAQGGGVTGELEQTPVRRNRLTGDHLL
jgi:hypothetical protein